MRARVAGIPVPLLVVGGVAAAYLLYTRVRAKSAAASTSSTTAAPAPSATDSTSSDQATAMAIEQGAQQQAQSNAQLAQTIQSNEAAAFANLEAQIAQMFPSGGSGTSSTSTTPPTSSTTPAPPPSSPGMGIVQTNLGPMVWLGVWGQAHYNVGGGAPVYFGNAQNLNQGSQYEIAGNDIYTPVAYAGLVSSGTST